MNPMKQKERTNPSPEVAIARATTIRGLNLASRVRGFWGPDKVFSHPFQGFKKRITFPEVSVSPWVGLRHGQIRLVLNGGI